MGGRIFTRQDADFPATPALQRRLAEAGRLATAPQQQTKPVASAPLETTSPADQLRPPPEASITLGSNEYGRAQHLSVPKLLDGRLLVQGVSGAGKSWTLRRLLEQSATIIQQIIIDPEGEFTSLAEELGYVHVAGDRLDAAGLAELGMRVRQHRRSIVLDLSQVDRESQLKAFAPFVTALIEAPREQWHPAMVAVDEAHLFAPFGGHVAAAPSVRKAAIGALTDLMGRGRKRGLVGVLATQRLARLAKSVVSEINNFLVGQNTLDLDIRRAAETIGWDSRKAFDRLPLLEPGGFVAVGPAFTQSPAIMRVGAVKSRHIGATPRLEAPPAASVEDSRDVLGLDNLMEVAEAEGYDAGDLDGGGRGPIGYKAVRAFVREPAFELAARVYGALTPLYPDGARLGDLAAHLGLVSTDIVSAVALLESFGVLEMDGSGPDTALRITKSMRA